MTSNKKKALVGIITLVFALICTSVLDASMSLNVPDNFTSVSTFFLTIGVGIITIIFALYFIYVQTYVNRYPEKLLGKLFGFPIKANISAIGILSFYGVSLILYPDRYLGHLFFWVSMSLSIIYSFVFALGSIKHLSVNACVNDYIENIQKSLAIKPETSEFQQILDELYSIYEECITKNEYYVCQIISESTQKMFESLLKEHNRLIIDKKLNEEDAIKLSSMLMNHTFKQIYCIRDINSPQFVEIVARMPLEYILSCINIGQYTLYKICLKSLAKKIFIYLNNDDSVQIAERLYYNIGEIVDALISEKGHKEWLFYVLETFFDMTLAYNYAKKNCGVRLFASLMRHTLEKCIRIEDDTYYEEVFGLFSKYITNIAHTQQNLDEIRLYFIGIAQMVIEQKNINRIDLFDNFLNSVQKNVISNNNWIELNFYYINLLAAKMPIEYEQKMHTKKISVLTSAISSDENPTNTIRLLLPDYENIIKNNKAELEKIKGYADELYDLCHRSIVKDNADIFYIFLETLNRSIVCLPKNAKDSQIELFSVYYKVLSLVSNINNQLFPEMTVSMLRHCIDDLDKNKSVSRDFAAYIIDKLRNIASRGSYVSNFLTDEIIDMLHSWYCEEDNELSFLVKDSESKSLFYKALYSIGTSCIEYGKEESLRKVSNTMGWSYIRSLERRDSMQNINYLFKLITSLYRIAADLGISKQTLTFLMTLYTTVGTYCELDPKYYGYQNTIIKFLSEYDINIIRIAAQIRTSENSVWDDLFKGKTDIFTKSFLGKIQKNIERGGSQSEKTFSKKFEHFNL